MMSFSFVQGKLQGVGSHDDTVMAFWMAERAAALGGGFGVWFGENAEAGPEVDESSPAAFFADLPKDASSPKNEATSKEEVDPDWFGMSTTPNVPGLGGVRGGGWW
jgi:hypothetical protein